MLLFFSFNYNTTCLDVKVDHSRYISVEACTCIITQPSSLCNFSFKIAILSDISLNSKEFFFRYAFKFQETFYLFFGIEKTETYIQIYSTIYLYRLKNKGYLCFKSSLSKVVIVFSADELISENV